MRSKRRIALLLILVFILSFISFEPVQADYYLGTYTSQYDDGIFDSVYFGDLLFVCQRIEYSDGRTIIDYDVVNEGELTYRGSFDFLFYNSDNREIFRFSKNIVLEPGERTWEQKRVDEDLSAASGWCISQASSVSAVNESSELANEHIIEEIFSMGQIQLYKTDTGYWIFECDIERLEKTEKEIPEKFELELLFQDTQGKQEFNKTVSIRMKDTSKVHMAFYTTKDMSDMYSFDVNLILPEQPTSSPVVTVVRNKNNMGALGRYLGNTQLGQFYIEDMMITDTRNFTCKVTNKGPKTEKGLFRLCFYREKEYFGTVLVYAGDEILPGESKQANVIANGNIIEADTVYIMKAEEFGGKKAEVLPTERVQPFPDDFHLQFPSYISDYNDPHVKFKLHSLKCQKDSTEFSYSLYDLETPPFEGEVRFSFFKDDVAIASLTDDISPVDCEKCKNNEEKGHSHKYIRTIKTGTDLSDANKLRVAFEGEEKILELKSYTNNDIISSRKLDDGVWMDDIYILDQGEKFWLRFHFQNRGKRFEKKDIICGFIDEEGRILTGVISARVFYQGREEWEEFCFGKDGFKNVADMILIYTESEDSKIFEKYAKEVTIKAPTEQSVNSPVPAPTAQPSQQPTLYAPSVQKPAETSKPAEIPRPKTKVTKLIKPQIKVTTQKYKKNIHIAKIRLKKYQGTYIEIYYRRGKGKFKKIKLKQCNIKNNKKLFKIGYKKGRKNIYIRVRTYQKKGGKKVYSPYSKSWRVR